MIREKRKAETLKSGKERNKVVGWQLSVVSSSCWCATVARRHARPRGRRDGKTRRRLAVVRLRRFLL